MPLATLARRAGALLLAGAGLISATGTAHATGTYTAVVFPDQSHTVVYNLINSATKSIDVTMYELRDTTAVNDLIARRRAGVKVRVILDAQHTSVNGSAYSALRAAGVGVTYSSSAFVYTHQKTVTVDGDDYGQTLWNAVLGNVSVDEAIEDLNTRYNDALERALEAGSTQRVIIEDYDPAHPSAGTVTYSAE